MQRLGALAEPGGGLVGLPLLVQPPKRRGGEIAGTGRGIHDGRRRLRFPVRPRSPRWHERGRAQSDGELVFRRVGQSAFGAQTVREPLERSGIVADRLQLDARQEHRAAVAATAREPRLIESNLTHGRIRVAVSDGKSLSRGPDLEQGAKRLHPRDVADATTDGTDGLGEGFDPAL